MRSPKYDLEPNTYSIQHSIHIITVSSQSVDATLTLGQCYEPPRQKLSINYYLLPEINYDGIGKRVYFE